MDRGDHEPEPEIWSPSGLRATTHNEIGGRLRGGDPRFSQNSEFYLGLERGCGEGHLLVVPISSRLWCHKDLDL